MIDLSGILRRLELLETQETRSGAGWVPAGETWAYNSATSFIAQNTDATGKYYPGYKINFTQTTKKYFYVTSTTYSAPNTVVNVTGGSDYSVANAAITAPFYSAEANPAGFPHWFNYSTTYAGFSANPTSINRFCVVGRIVTVVIAATGSGTSNATNYTLTAPITSANITNHVWGGVCWLGADNSAYLTTPATYQITSNSNTINLYKTSVPGSTWTATGGKYAGLTAQYEI